MNQNVTKHGVKLNQDRKVEKPSMWSNLVLRTRGGYTWMMQAGAEDSWISNGWMGPCTFATLLDTYGPVVIVNPGNEGFHELPMITTDGYLVESL